MFFTGVINLYLCCDFIYSEMWKLLELPAFTSCRSVRMYTATKSFERFRQPKSVEDEKKSDDNAIPKSTAYNTKWSCKVFEEWKRNRLVKSCSLEPGGLFTTKDFEERVQAVEVRSRSKQLFWGTLFFPFVVLNYLRTEAPPSWCKWKCCIEPFGHVRPKVSYIFGDKIWFA